MLRQSCVGSANGLSQGERRGGVHPRVITTPDAAPSSLRALRGQRVSLNFLACPIGCSQADQQNISECNHDQAAYNVTDNKTAYVCCAQTHKPKPTAMSGSSPIEKRHDSNRSCHRPRPLATTDSMLHLPLEG